MVDRKARVSGRRATLVLIVVAGLGLAATTGAALMVLSPAISTGVAVPVLLVGLAAGVIALWLLIVRMVRLYDGLDRLRGDLAGSVARRRPPGRPDGAPQDPDATRLVGLVADLAGALADQQARPDARLAAVVGALEDAVLVVTENGQVSLVNGAAKALFGAERVAVGTSLYAALDRDDAANAAAAARAAGRPSEATIRTVDGVPLTARVADLGEHRGTLYRFAAPDHDSHGELEHDLALHDRPPPPVAPTDEAPLHALSVLALDTETTGLQVATDRVVAVGAVCVGGGTIYRAETMDLLVDPGVPIPSRATRIHGITDAMVAGAPSFSEIAGALDRMTANRVVMGHNIGFDLAVLGAECRRAGLDWIASPSLDLVQLGAALEPRNGDLTLDGMAARYGVAVAGRHTALGDALVAAELWLCLVPRLAEHGVETFGAATVFAARAREVIRNQRRSGW